MSNWLDLTIEEKVRLIEEVGRLWESGEYNLAEIGDKVGYSRERCRQLVRKYQYRVARLERQSKVKDSSL